MKKCPYCNTLNPDDAEVCENCGKPLKGRMLALVCPNCGKVNALGSRECSVCHTKLSQSNHQLVSREITPRKNNKRWGYIALIAFGLLIALFTYLGTKNARNPLTPSKIETLEFSYFDKNKEGLYKDYYIVNVPNTLLCQHFSIAYIGRNAQGARLLKVVTLKKTKKLYRQNKHYSLYVRKRDVIVSGPQRVIIRNGAEMFSTAPGRHNKIYQQGRNSCVVKGNKQVKLIKIQTLILIDDY
ncbi:zinc ribbon domain-containing protein [Limosilactobacillus reuteri]|uniref:Uncharacterized protein n=1 Tax=Limosilactobacillus reuteri TaxID=1598 RepID=A0A347T9G3_LIMRT|nr:zinc ribbon domain-containing protein [Limosilactobacillus reuteri]AXX74562.1 hypothetical protein DL317_07545 [Limosilactobacillus reuteri]MRG68417.1 hypothetical protein [Limosilactobacillus reuteri]